MTLIRYLITVIVKIIVNLKTPDLHIYLIQKCNNMIKKMNLVILNHLVLQ